MALPPRSRHPRAALARVAIAVICALARPNLLVRAALPLTTCAQVKTCYVSAAATSCDVTLEKCPPCIFPNANKFNCFPYDAEARATTQCPYATTNSNYVDCSTAANWTKWATSATAKSANATTIKPLNATASGNSTASSNGTTTVAPATTSSSKSKLVLFGGIGVGVLVLLIIVLAICKRRKRQQVRRNTVARHMARTSSKRVKTKHDEAFGGGGGGGGNAYNHMDTSKAGGGGGAYGSYQPHEALSVDGMLGDAPLTPVVLGGGGGRHTGKSQKAAGTAKTNNGFTSVNDLVTQDISIRCTTSANVFDEYLRMKQEMNYDHDDDGMSDVLSEMSDLDSDTMSLHKFSLESSQGIVGMSALARHDGGLSITDSEYDEHMRNRGASECYSEMSYNDEKYSFSEDDDMSSEFARSKVGGGTSVPDREVEI